MCLVSQICRLHLCPPILTQQLSHRFRLAAAAAPRVLSPPNFRRYRHCQEALTRQTLQLRHRLLLHLLIYRYYRRPLRIPQTRPLRFRLSYPL